VRHEQAHRKRLKEIPVRTPLIGILGGMGPFSTGTFLDLVAAACSRLHGARHDIDFPRMLVCSQPAPFYPDREPDHEAIEAATLEGLLTLEHAGVDFIAMACNTVHAYHGRLARRLGVPLLNIVDATVAALGQDLHCVALIAARATAESGLYPAAIETRGGRCVDIGMQASIDQLLTASRNDTRHEECRQLWHGLLAAAQSHGATRTVVACLDLSASIRRHGLQSQVLDTAVCLAEATVLAWCPSPAEPRR
jgi:aspartate racemase